MGDAEVAPFRTDGAGGPIGVPRAGDVLVGPEDFCNRKREAISGRIRDIVEAQFVAGVAALMPKIYLTAASDMLMKALKSSADMKYFLVNLQAGIRGFKSLIPRTGVPPQLEERELNCRSFSSMAFDSGEQYRVSTSKCVKTGRNARKILMVLFFLAGICISGMVETRKTRTINLKKEGYKHSAFNCSLYNPTTVPWPKAWRCFTEGTVSRSFKWQCKGEKKGEGNVRFYSSCATVVERDMHDCQKRKLDGVTAWWCEGNSERRTVLDPEGVYNGVNPNCPYDRCVASVGRKIVCKVVTVGEWYERCVEVKS